MANNAATKPIQGPQGPQGNTGSTGPAPDVTRLSTTSLAIATGSKAFVFTVVSNQLGWLVGSRLRAASQANGGNYMEGLVTAVSTSGVTITVDLTGGSGTHADWNIFIIGNTGTIASRSNVVFITGSIAAGGFESGFMPIARSFAIIAVSVDRSCRVRLYATAAQRDADVLRGTFTPPQVNTSHGVILDIVLDGSTPAPLSNFICSPEAYGANGDVVPSSSIYYTITNNTLGASTVQVTLLVKIEEV